MPSSRSPRRAGHTLAAWQPAQWAAAGAGAALTAVLVGMPTAVIPSPVFSRSVPVQWWNYPVLATTAVLAGLVLATYLRVPRGAGGGAGARNAAGARDTDAPDGTGAPDGTSATGTTPGDTGARLGSLGGLLSLFAVGCPVCNKLVLALLGTSGALTYWAPLQPLVAVASLVLLAEAALRRLSVADACPVPARS